MSEYYGVLNLPTLQEVAEIVSRFSEPSNDYMARYIAKAQFTYMPVENEKSYHKYEQLKGWRPDYKLCHFIKDGKPVNDKMYGMSCDLKEWYGNTFSYANKKKLFDFFKRYEVAHYTAEECKDFNEKKKKWKLAEPERKVGQEYLKITWVIIDLQTGEEMPVEISEFNRGYIVYGKYYKPDNKRELYDIKTGKLVLKYGYRHEIESDNYVFFDTEHNYNEPKKVLMLNKETGEVTEWV